MSSGTSASVAANLKTGTGNAPAPLIEVRHGSESATIPQPIVATPDPVLPQLSGFRIVADAEQMARETFIPITKAALIDRLTHDDAWAPGLAKDARKFFQYLDYWRRQTYSADLREVDKAYEAFNPDSDLLATRAFSDTDRARMQARVVSHVQSLLLRSNYTRILPTDLAAMTQGSHYGLDLHVDLDAFDELLVYYRGRSTKKEHRREIRKFYRKTEFELPIFRRLFVLFKLKTADQRIAHLMATKGIERREAVKAVKKLSAQLPAAMLPGNIYMKLFKNMPRSDIEMIFPNTRVRFRMMDKVRLGVTSGAGVGMGLFGAVGKIALAATNPIAAAGAVAGLGGLALRQGMNFMNQRQRYMVVMAQNLYFHAMADNRSAMIKLADRAAEEDVKEEMLLYSVLAKEPVPRSDIEAVDTGIERYLRRTFDIEVNFDLQEALDRLIHDGLVKESADGILSALSPSLAAKHLDGKWDVFLDHLIADDTSVGVEVER